MKARLTKARIASVLAASMLAACAATVTSQDLISVRPGEAVAIDPTIRTLTSAGVVPLVIHGHPFMQPAAAFTPSPGNAITDALRMPASFAKSEFVQTPEAQAGKGLRLVLVFDPKDRETALRAACGDASGVEFAEPGERLSVSVAVCNNDSFRWGAVAETTRPELMDEDFASFLNGILITIFPSDVSALPRG